MTITIAIPTYNRGAILVETIERLLTLAPRADAILIADQTKQHPADVEQRLRSWHDEGAIRWMRLEEPSIPKAMNDALLAATTELVLFFDDDLIPDGGIVAAHTNAHQNSEVWAVAGQVLQPGEQPDVGRGFSPPLPGEGGLKPRPTLDFKFNSSQGAFITNVMAGNLSVKRERALAIGGFDENFIGAAYRFETDFAMRVAAAGGRIWFEPNASIRHLQLSTGGLRSYGDHRSAPVPAHSAGDYYFALQHMPRFWRYAARRIVQNVATRYLATHPWLIPAKLIGETRGLLLARELHRKGRRLRVVPAGKP
ncbi:MAG TPA: glycosyltransferase [Thermoanaerobaculia bacterium]|nr:glycosyltransferase [Thermoanaerobaculia bacterium]